MRLNQSEIVEAILEHIRQCGGDFTEWCVGTAKQGLGARDWGLGNEKSGLGARDLGLGGGRQQTVDGRRETDTAAENAVLPAVATTTSEPAHLIYREAYTKYAAAEVVERLTDFGIRPDHQSSPTPGDIVFVYRPRAAEMTCQSERP